jgi:anti-sigma B factor antagonist
LFAGHGLFSFFEAAFRTADTDDVKYNSGECKWSSEFFANIGASDNGANLDTFSPSLYCSGTADDRSCRDRFRSSWRGGRCPSPAARRAGGGLECNLMPESTQSFALSTVKDVSVVEFTNNKILDESVLEDIRNALGAMIEAATKPKILLDFSNVDHMSSAALGMLINVNKSIRDKNGQLRLTNIKPQIFEVFVTTKLNMVFKVLPDRAAALASFT